VKCGCGCGEEFPPTRGNRRYVDPSHRARAANRRYPVRRQKLFLPHSPDAHHRPQEAQTAYVTEADRGQVREIPRQPRFLTIREVSELLRRPKATLLYWRRSGTGPRFTKLGYHSLVYDRRDLEAWLRKCIQTKVQPRRKREL
jgi:predicted DNA-binding transcriptional regulator AlpA